MQPAISLPAGAADPLQALAARLAVEPANRLCRWRSSASSSCIFVQKAPISDPSGLESFPLYFLCRFILQLLLAHRGRVDRNGAGRRLADRAFPHEHLVLSVVFAQFVTVLIELGVLTVAMLIAGNMVLPWLPVLFVIMVLLAIFSTGVAMLLASANVYFNDVTYLWAIAAQLLFYATPVIWDPESVGSRG